MVLLVVKVPPIVKLGDKYMLDLFSFMRSALAGRFTTSCEHFHKCSRINVYSGREFQFDITVTDQGYTIKELNGTVLNKGTTFVDYTTYIRDTGRLNSSFEV